LADRAVGDRRVAGGPDTSADAVAMVECEDAVRHRQCAGRINAATMFVTVIIPDYQVVKGQ
jgi:hypothetical protein